MHDLFHLAQTMWEQIRYEKMIYGIAHCFFAL